MEPAKPAAARVAEVGDVAVEEAPVVAPQRQAPHRIVELPRRAPASFAASFSSLQKSTGSSGPSATRAAPVSVAKSMMVRGLPSAA